MLPPFSSLRTVLSLGGIPILLLLGLPHLLFAQLSTAEHLAKPGFWPTKVNRSSEEFVGSAVCAKCHAHIASVQETTPMAQSLTKASNSGVLRSHSSLEFESGQYEYEIATAGSESTYTVTDGTRTISAALIWAFGDGQVGQSYLFQNGGQWYEARASFFGSLNSLHFTPGRALPSPQDLKEARSRMVSSTDVMRCFKCHATGVTSDRTVSTANLFLGISCEACHGPGARHVAEMQTEIFAAGASVFEKEGRLIVNPGLLDPNDSVDFCGACHGTWWDVRLTGNSGIDLLLSPPYRLEESKCWGKGTARLTCVACHDPHAPRERQAAYYDAKCSECHSAGASISGDPPARTCPVGKTKCVSCHMPKIELPSFHHNFTDHRIRIVHPGESFPS